MSQGATGEILHARGREWLCGVHRRGGRCFFAFRSGSGGRAGQADGVGDGGQPGGARAGPFAARGGVQRWTAPCRALIPGMGKVHFPVTTSNPDAQNFVDQGVAQLHSFYYFESERSFRQAARIDPGCAMAYWGMAMSNINNPKRASGFLKEARKRAAGITSRESLYLAALESCFKDGGNVRVRRQGWLQGLEAVVQDSPGDIDARAWLAMVTWQNSMDGIGSRQAVDIVLDTVLQVEGDASGCPPLSHPSLGWLQAPSREKSAGLYAKTAPGIAHAWHMPGHTYTELKRYAEAAYQQEGSARVDHAYMNRDKVMPFRDSQLRAQQPVALHELEPYRAGA